MLNPSGFCKCGCGRRTALSDRSARGYKRGEPMKFIRGHHRREVGPEYRIEDRGHDTPCWIYTRSIGSTGYGRVWNGSGHVMAHRVFYERAIGAIPGGHDLHHLCSVPACVNPDHLEAMSRIEHMRCDGRAEAIARRVTSLSRERGLALAEERWPKIERLLRAGLNQKQIAQKLGLQENAVSKTRRKFDADAMAAK